MKDGDSDGDVDDVANGASVVEVAVESSTNMASFDVKCAECIDPT